MSAYQLKKGSYYGEMSMKFATNGFDCFCYEEELLDCLYDTFSTCGKFEAAGVICSMKQPNKNPCE